METSKNSNFNHKEHKDNENERIEINDFKRTQSVRQFLEIS